MLRTVRVFARDLVSQRPVCAEEDVHFSEGLAAAVIDAFSGKGDRVLDPFAGFGTTLVVSERMGRTAVGIELLPDRVAMIAARLGGAARVLQGDARRLDDLGLGSFELCLTSPPYMTAFAHPQNPLTGYRTLDGSYPVYLAELGDVFSAVGRHLTPGGHCLINVANIARPTE
jgi:DNA modification methylase